MFVTEKNSDNVKNPPQKLMTVDFASSLSIFAIFIMSNLNYQIGFSIEKCCNSTKVLLLSVNPQA